MGRRDERWVSEELSEVLFELTAQQSNGVLRIVQAELDGRSISSLLDCPEQICTSTTYYGSGKRKGWRGKPAFVEALKLARRDYRSWMLENGTTEAMMILSQAASPAARDLERQVTGDNEAVAALARALGEAVANGDEQRVVAVASALGETGRPAALPPLERALANAVDWDQGVYTVLVQAVGRIAGAVDVDRQKADVAILDRADVKTASKGTVAETGEKTLVVKPIAVHEVIVGLTDDSGPTPPAVED